MQVANNSGLNAGFMANRTLLRDTYRVCKASGGAISNEGFPTTSRVVRENLANAK
jgi:hypothetical protein